MFTAQLASIFLLCLVLIYSTGLIVHSILALARTSRLGAYGITAFILAISTSLPELFVSIVASIEGNTSLVLGNIIGSNIADIGLVIGGAALVGGSLKVNNTIVNRDIFLAGAAGLLPIFLIADGTLSRADGIVLLVIYVIMVMTLLRSHQRSLMQSVLSPSPLKRLLSAVTGHNGHGSIAKFAIGVGLLLVSSHLIVRFSSALASSTGVSTLFIGLFIVAIGTSLPELAFELKAIAAGHTVMALGDLLGSVVANSTLILGVAALIRPLTLTPRGLLPYGTAIGVFTTLYIAFIFFVRSKKRLEWWEGLLLLSVYVLFIFIEYMSQSLYVISHL